MEDSFDDILATFDDPTAPKLQKIEQPSSSTILKPNNVPSTSTPKTNAVNKAHCVLVSTKQRGNPLLKSVTNVPWEYDDIVPDYIMGRTTCALFLSLRYHNLNPDYIHERLKTLGKSFELRVLLVLVDLKDPHNVLKYLTRMCILADLTLMLAWNSEEAGKIIETYKMFESKPPDLIMERAEQYPHQKLVSALTNVKPVNKTDAMTLLSTFGSLANIIKAPEHKLAQCPGFGARKATKLHKTLHEPFLKKVVTHANKSNVITPSTSKEFDYLLNVEDNIDAVLDKYNY